MAFGKKKGPAKAKGSKMPSSPPVDETAKTAETAASSEGSDNPSEPPEPPKIVLKDKHALRDPKAKTLVRCKITQNVPAAGGGISQLRKGKSVMVPSHAVEDLRNTKCIY